MCLIKNDSGIIYFSLFLTLKLFRFVFLFLLLFLSSCCSLKSQTRKFTAEYAAVRLHWFSFSKSENSTNKMQPKESKHESNKNSKLFSCLNCIRILILAFYPQQKINLKKKKINQKKFKKAANVARDRQLDKKKNRKNSERTTDRKAETLFLPIWNLLNCILTFRVFVLEKLCCEFCLEIYCDGYQLNDIHLMCSTWMCSKNVSSIFYQLFISSITFCGPICVNEYLLFEWVHKLGSNIRIYFESNIVNWIWIRYVNSNILNNDKSRCFNFDARRNAFDFDLVCRGLFEEDTYQHLLQTWIHQIK